MDNLKRLRTLSGLLKEAVTQVPYEDDEEQDRLDNERYAFQEVVKHNITAAFARIGLEVGDIFYSHEDREAIVELDDHEADLAKLARLQQSGLSDRFTISSATHGSFHGIDVTFIVAPGIEHAKPNNGLGSSPTRR